MISLDNITIGYGSRVLLKDACATFGNGSLTALIGRNGSGKSTILNAMARLNTAYSGTISIDGDDSVLLSAQQMARRLAFVSTARTRPSNMTAFDVVALGRMPYTNWIGSLSRTDRDIISNSLAQVGMSGFSARSIDTMSDGERQRVFIARALAQDTTSILLDEPTSFLDLPNRYELADLLLNLAHNCGKAIVFSTHELDIAMHMTDSVAIIGNCSLYQDSPQNIISNGLIESLFGKRSAMFLSDFNHDNIL